MTVAYPFLLAVYADVATGVRTEDEFCAVLEAVENYLVRRFVCGVPTYGLNKIFAPLYEQATRGGYDLTAGVRKTLSSSPRGYPRDDEFRERLGSARLYGGGDRREKTKLILERLEGGLGHKEIVPGASLTIEHVMPQTLSDAWKEHLGPTWEEDQEQFLHTLGNLTLTNYNAELSNAPYGEKRTLFATSHVELNRHFESVDRWTATEIEHRSEILSDLALSLWPYFGTSQGDADADTPEDLRVTGKVPRLVRVRGEERAVQSWVDVAFVTMEAIAKIGEDEFSRVVEEMPKFANRDATAFRRTSRLKKLSNGAYVETNISASTIHRLCVQAAQLAGLDREDWSVEFAPAPGEDDADQTTQIQNADLEHLRASAAYAAEQFELLAGKAGTEPCARLLADAIERAISSDGPWSITLHPKRIFLNVGSVRLFSLSPAGLWLISTGEGPLPTWIEPVDVEPVIVYASVPVLARSFWLRPEGLGDLPPLLRAGFLSYVEEAASRRRGSRGTTWAKAHSTGVVAFLNDSLGRQLPSAHGAASASKSGSAA